MSEGSRATWLLVLAAAAVMVITNGSRQSLGLFVSPLNTSSGLGIVGISFALAVGQFVWGAVQPLAGAIADRRGPTAVLAGGIVLIAVGFALVPLLQSSAGMILTLGVLLALGGGAASFSVLIGLVAKQLPPERHGTAAGVINAGSSFGQFLFAPITQGLIGLFGWVAALWSLAAITLCALPLVRVLGSSHASAGVAHTPIAGQGNLKEALANALRNPSYLLLHAGFFTCGFHIAFLVTHLPGEVQLCGLSPAVASWSLALIGLSNIAGSLFAGHAMRRHRGKYILFWMYGSRAALVALYLLAPKTAPTFFAFAVGLGLTWLATVPPTAGVVGRLFGARYLSTLFGLTLVSHQVGAFFGAWLGGVALSRFGNYNSMWIADIALAALAALCNLPIREPLPPAVEMVGA